MGAYAGVDYNLTLCLFEGRLQHIYHARVDFILQSGTLDLASVLRIRGFFGPWIRMEKIQIQDEHYGSYF
jgi:hypothetical protein